MRSQRKKVWPMKYYGGDVSKQVKRLSVKECFLKDKAAMFLEH